MTLRSSTTLACALLLCGPAGCATGETDADSPNDFFNPRARDDIEDVSCAFDMEYWQEHHMYADPVSKRQPWPLWEDNYACGATWLQWLWTEPEGDPAILAGQQFIVAMLNEAQGAPLDVESSELIGYTMQSLEDCSAVGEEEHLLDLAAGLEAFNAGELSAPACAAPVESAVPERAGR